MSQTKSRKYPPKIYYRSFPSRYVLPANKQAPLSPLPDRFGAPQQPNYEYAAAVASRPHEVPAPDTGAERALAAALARTSVHPLRETPAEPAQATQQRRARFADADTGAGAGAGVRGGIEDVRRVASTIMADGSVQTLVRHLDGSWRAETPANSTSTPAQQVQVSCRATDMLTCRHPIALY